MRQLNSESEGESIQRGKSSHLEIEEVDISTPLMHEDHTGQFSHAIQYWLSGLGSAVGYGNIWRFPYVLFNNGGGAFFIPYFVCIFIIVLPLYYLEGAYGQMYKKALHRYYDSIHTKFLGLSIAIAWVVFFTSIFLSALGAWGVNFLLFSFQDPLPWDANSKDSGVFWKEGYFRDELLHASSGIDDFNFIVFFIAISFVIGGVINYLTISKSLKSAGYAVYVIIPLPYILLTILFIRGVTLPGFFEGWKYLFQPDWSKIFTFKIWKDAGAQVIFSCSLGVNIMMLFASNRNKNDHILSAAIGVPIMNFMTSIFSSMTLFAFLGYASVKMDIPISSMPIEGIELAFVVYPALITTLPWPQLWSILFFVMLICLGLSSQFPYYEVCSTFIHGMMSRTKVLNGISKHTVVVVYGLLILIIDVLLIASDAGLYWFTLFDHYSAGMNLLIVLLVQTIVLGWYLDLNELEEKVKLNGETIPWIYKISIKYISPAFLVFIVGLGFIDEITQPLDMPLWAQGLGWILLFFPVFAIIHSLIFR